jgi:hypothetical protein
LSSLRQYEQFQSSKNPRNLSKFNSARAANSVLTGEERALLEKIIEEEKIEEYRAELEAKKAARLQEQFNTRPPLPLAGRSPTGSLVSRSGRGSPVPGFPIGMPPVDTVNGMTPEQLNAKKKAEEAAQKAARNASLAALAAGPPLSGPRTLSAFTGVTRSLPAAAAAAADATVAPATPKPPVFLLGEEGRAGSPSPAKPKESMVGGRGKQRKTSRNQRKNRRAAPTRRRRNQRKSRSRKSSRRGNL